MPFFAEKRRRHKYSQICKTVNNYNCIFFYGRKAVFRLYAVFCEKEVNKLKF